jgi:polysaccharide biosynthesis/export protein
MKIKKVKFRGQFIILIIILMFPLSCVPVEKLRYFNDIDNLQEPSANPREQKLIIPFDKIFIRVFSIDEKTNQLFNSNTGLPMNSSSSLIGYLVDETGNINYPFIGNIKISGLNAEQAGSKIGKALSEYVSNAAVSVKFIDNNITVIGEVQQQGVYAFNQDKLNIYEALALGGGISRYGNRKEVILIRQEGDKIMHHKLDLSNSGIAGKEYYYIQANDVIVVEPLRSSSWYNFNNSTFSTIVSSITAVFAIVVFFLK